LVPRIEARTPQRLLEELTRCIELGDCLTQDADSLIALAAADSLPVPPDIAGAMQQLIKTARSLAARLQHLAEAESLKVSARRAAPQAEPPATTPPPMAETPEKSESLAALDAEEEEFKNCRRFPRSQFRGSAKATIYPPPSMPGNEPVHCTVLTRDLSCGGIGIAHSRQLYPRQIVVLDALGKLLVGEVRWCRRVEDGFYVAGCRLVKTSE
jgi:hypothetical protein